MINFSMFWLNNFSVSSGVRGNLSLTTIITGFTINFEVQCKIEFGVYTQVHEFTKPRNSRKACTLGVVGLGPSGNMKGG